jgi:outer membrane protein TolC
MLLHSVVRAALRGVIFLLGIAVTTGYVAAQPPMPAVTGMPEEFLPGLDPLLKSAVMRSPDAIKRSLDVDAAEARKIIGESVLWPSLYGSARYAVNDEAVSGNSGTSNRSSGFFYNFMFNQPVYHWGALKAQADHERIALKIAERQFADATRLLLQQVRKTYLELVVRKAGLRALRSQLAADEKAVEEQKARLKEGVVVAGEVASAELGVRRRKLEIAMAESAYEFAKSSLSRLSGVENLAEESIPFDFPRPKTNPSAAASLLQQFTQGGVMNTYQAQVFGMMIQQSEKDYVIAKHRLYPKFSIFAGYDVRSETQASTSSINQVAVADRTYGIKTDWYMFDGWATKGQKLAALVGKRTNARLLQTHIETTVEQARAQHQQLDFSAQSLDLAEMSVVGAQSTLKEVESELAAGRMARADLERARIALLRAEADILPARAEYLNRWSEFVSLVGADPAMSHVPSRYVR